MIKKDLIIAILGTFCLTSALFMVLPTRSSTTNGPKYDPWLDFDDDGYIGLSDLVSLAKVYGTTGTPINKTALLLELQLRIDSLNSSLLDLEAYLKTRITNLEALVAEQQSQIASLLEIVHAIEANYSVTNLRLAPYAIPFVSAYSLVASATSEMYSWVDMPNMSVSITLNRTSHVLVMWSAEANQDDWRNTIYVRALVGESIANPGAVILTPIVHDVAGHTHSLDYSVYSYIFYRPSVTAGNYTIKMQWQVSGGVGRVWYRTLTVIALPA
jgi:hypothetical protein